MKSNIYYFLAASSLGAGIGALLFGGIGALICMIICGYIMYATGNSYNNSSNGSQVNIVPHIKKAVTIPPEETTHKVKSFNSNTYYEIILKQLTCTCPDWIKNRGLLPLNDPRRLCKHLIRFLCEDRSNRHNFTLFQEKLDWCFENGRGFPINCEIFRSEDNEFEIVGFIPNVEQWNFNGNGFWIDIYYKNIKFGFNPVINIWTKNSKILTDDINIEKAILTEVLPTYPFWEKNKDLINKQEKPQTKLQSIYNPERREYLNTLDDCDRLVDILSDTYSNRNNFELFGTKASILWSDGITAAAVICLNRFSREKPATGSRYDYYEFNIIGWYWSGFQPRGCSNRIKEELSLLFRK